MYIPIWHNYIFILFQKLAPGGGDFPLKLTIFAIWTRIFKFFLNIGLMITS